MPPTSLMTGAAGRLFKCSCSKLPLYDADFDRLGLIRNSVSGNVRTHTTDQATGSEAVAVLTGSDSRPNAPLAKI